MQYAASLAEKREYLRALEQKLQQLPLNDRPTSAVLRAEMRWERAEIREVEQAVRLVGWP